MTTHFRFIIELETKTGDSPAWLEYRETFAKIQRLSQQIAADKEMVKELYKAAFLELLFGDYYSETLHSKLNPKSEEELILPAALSLESGDTEFFEQLLRNRHENKEKVDKDSLMNLFYSQFGNPEIIDVRFEAVSPT